MNEIPPNPLAKRTELRELPVDESALAIQSRRPTLVLHFASNEDLKAASDFVRMLSSGVIPTKRQAIPVATNPSLCVRCQRSEMWHPDASCGRFVAAEILPDAMARLEAVQGWLDHWVDHLTREARRGLASMLPTPRYRQCNICRRRHPGDDRHPCE
jgi:hypothetical protein